MPTASIAVGNLKSTALYVDHFLVNVFADSALTQLQVSTSCPAVNDGAGNWVQKNMISIWGLNLSQEYWLQVGPVTSGGIPNFTTYSIFTGSEVIPTCTYPGTFKDNSSGITYLIEPEGVPTNIDHYEAFWSKDGTNPSNTSAMNMWQGHPNPAGIIQLFVGGNIGDVITLWMRSMTTSGNYQGWVETDSRAVTQLPTTGATYADGTPIDALRPSQPGADVTINNAVVTSVSVNLNSVSLTQPAAYTVAKSDILINGVTDVVSIQAVLQWGVPFDGDTNSDGSPIVSSIGASAPGVSQMFCYIDTPDCVGTGPLYGTAAPSPSYQHFGFGVGSGSGSPAGTTTFFGTITGLPQGTHWFSLNFLNPGTYNEPAQLYFLYYVITHIKSS